MTRALLRPVTAVRRHRAKRLEGINVGVFEANAYRPSFLRFYHASKKAPILVDVDVPPGGLVFDVGAFDGGWTQRFLKHADREGRADLRLIAFEPDPSSVARFRVVDPRVDVRAYGLAESDQMVQMALAGQGSTIYAEAGDLGFTTVELRDVASVLEGETRLDFVKVNIEGGEFALIDRLHETGWLQQTGTIIVQFHEFLPRAHRLRRRARRLLSETHDCTWDFPWVYERWDQR